MNSFMTSTIVGCRRIIIIWGFVFSLISCDKFGPTPPASKVAIIPGECLARTQLGYVDYGQESISNGKTGLVIGFKIYWNTEGSLLNSDIYGILPSKDTYSAFGKDSKKVKTSFNKIFDTYAKNVNRFDFNGCTSTVYYCGGMVLTADSSFAGIPSGDNLAPVVLPFTDDPGRWEITPIPTIDIVDTYYPFADVLRLIIPLDSYSLIREAVTFHLEIPVKTGLLLTLLRDRLTDPDAQMQYRDEVLTCDFTINHGLH